MLSKSFARNISFWKNTSVEKKVDRIWAVTKMVNISPRKKFKAHVHVSDEHMHFNGLHKKAENVMVAASRIFKDSIFQSEIAHFAAFDIFVSSGNAKCLERE